MTSRRQFLRRTATTSAAVAGATLAAQPLALFAQGTNDDLTVFTNPEAATAALPSPEVIALNRMGFGPARNTGGASSPTPGSIAYVQRLGLNAYIEEQLNPDAIDDSACDAILAATTVRISYGPGGTGMTAYPGKTALEPLQTLNQNIDQLWQRASGVAPYQSFTERTRPVQEVRVATWIRATHSRRQLLEALVEFWHDHFSVYAGTSGEVSATWPLYNRIFRQHALGNFREMVEAVGRSVAMMYYLNNRNNQAGGGEGANENYARELFELHTLGSKNYLRFYDNKFGNGKITYKGVDYVRGYVDEDVYEAANAFTGWSIADGDNNKPDTGAFHYKADWHDATQKQILNIGPGNNLSTNQPAEKDGEDVFSMLCNHPGTAEHIITKLYTRYIGETPSYAVVEAAKAKWMDTVNAPDQLQQVMRVILTSTEFKTTWGKRAKRPFSFVVGYFRTVGATLPVDTATEGRWGALTDPWGEFAGSGNALYEWRTPTGYPDKLNYWFVPNSLLRRWNHMYRMTQSWGGGVQTNLPSQTNFGQSVTQIVDAWIAQLFGYAVSDQTHQVLIDFMRRNTGDATLPPFPGEGEWFGNPTQRQEILNDRLNAMVWLLAMSPEYQVQ